MAFSTRELLLVAVQGEGDRDKVNQLADVDRRIKVQGLMQTAGRPIPEELTRAVDAPPDVTVILRDPLSPDQPCVQYVLNTWEEVDGFKAANDGQHWDPEKKQFVFSRVDQQQGRHMPFGTVKVTFE